ncbi:hypothetical protein ACTJJB_02245 [Chitinophaga sp. 22536]|uniref:hypothetical protein n=1 Tax=unclassified Chitinophaga TaxID=2619133 RepID=UPI003F8327A3
MNNYLKHWNFMRTLRLALGILIIVQGIIAKEWLLAGLGGLFSLMPLMNTGCCGVSGCSTPIPRNNKKTEDITYEEAR